MTDRELMQMALDALEHLQTDIEWQYKSPTRAMLRTVEKSLRAALAQPEPEPINYEEWNYDPMTGKPLWDKKPEPEPVAYDVNGATVYIKPPIHNGKYLTGYAAPPQREFIGLTDEEITETLKRFGLGERAALARAIEAKLKEKNNG